MMVLTPYMVTWAFLALVVLGLACYRLLLAHREDDSIHVRDADQGMVAEQAAMAQRLETIDRLGKILTVVAFVSGLVLLGIYMYITFVTNSQASLVMQ